MGYGAAMTTPCAAASRPDSDLAMHDLPSSVEPAYWSLPAADLLQELASTEQGLAQTQARTRLRQFGPNVVQVLAEATLWSLLRRQLLSPLVLILLLGALVSLLLQE